MIRSPVWAATALALLAICALAACKSPTGAQSDAREIRIVMTDFKYEPDQIAVKPGERVRFVLVNQGTVEHELVLGDQAKQDQHEAEMAKGGHHMGNGPGEKSVAAGKTDRMEFTFPSQPGTLIYGCHVPGHWTSGMKGTVTIQ
jgi:uncharacterized cupredoxin-like copper-binding protein